MNDQTQPEVIQQDTAPASAASPSSLPSATAPAQGQPERPEWLPEAFWDAEKREAKAADLKKYASKAAVQLPAKFEDYAPDLGGVKDIELNTKDPGFAEFQKLMFELGAPQEAFGKATGIFAKSIAAFKQATVDGFAKMQKTFDDTRFAEFGENATGRIEELGKFAAGYFANDQKKADQAVRMVRVAEAGGLELLEGLKKAIVSQGVSKFTQLGRTTAEPDDGKPANWNKMSAVDRRTWQLQQQRERAGAGRH